MDLDFIRVAAKREDDEAYPGIFSIVEQIKCFLNGNHFNYADVKYLVVYAPGTHKRSPFNFDLFFTTYNKSVTEY